MFLTIITEVVNQNDLLDQLLRASVQDTATEQTHHHQTGEAFNFEKLHLYDQYAEGLFILTVIKVLYVFSKDDVKVVFTEQTPTTLPWESLSWESRTLPLPARRKKSSCGFASVRSEKFSLRAC